MSSDLRRRWAEMDEIWRRSRPSGKPANDGVLPYTKYVNRPLGRIAAVGAYLLGFSPNGLTILSSAISVLSFAVLLLFPVGFLVAALLVITLLAGYVLDSADGRLSRLTNQSSRLGEWLDHTLDVFKLVMAHGACLAILSRSPVFASQLATLAGLIILGIAVLHFHSTTLRDKLLSPDELASKSVAGQRHSILRGIILSPFDYGVFCLIFLLAPWPTTFAFVYFVWGLVALARLIGSMRRSAHILASTARVEH